MDFNSIYTTIGLVIAAALVDGLFMLWLRRRKRIREEEGVRFLGEYSPLLTRLRGLPSAARAIFSTLAHPRELPRRLEQTFSGWYVFLRGLVEAHTSAVRAGLMIAAAALALIGQIFFFVLRDPSGGWPWQAVAGALWLSACLLLLTDPFPSETDPSNFDEPVYLIRRRDFRLVALFLSVQTAALAVYQYANRPSNFYHWDIFALWLGSVLFLCLGLCPAPRRLQLASSLRTHWKALLPFALVTLLAAALRFYRLGQIPVVMENDEGLLGMHAVSVLTGAQHNMFAIFGGYGTLYFFLQAVPVELFGHTAFALRIITALAGTLTIPLTAWMAYRLFGYRISLVATALLAASHLHIQFSRVSPSASSFDPLFSALLVLLLYEALTRRRPWGWAAVGLIMGLGMYFYVGARVMLLITLAVFIVLIALRRKWFRPILAGLAPLAAGYLIMAAPMLAYAWRSPNVFNERLNQVGIFQNGWLTYQMGRTGQSALGVLADQLKDALLIFNFHPAQWFYQAQAPILGLVGGGLLLLGLVFAITRLNRLPVLLISAWFGVTLVSGQVLVLDPPTNAYRTLGLMPAACLLMALAAVLLADHLGGLWQRYGRAFAIGALAVLVAVEAGWNVWYYYGDWAVRYRYGDENTQRAALIGAYLADQPSLTQVIAAGSDAFRVPGWSSIEFLKGSTFYFEVEPPLAETIPAMQPAPNAVVIVPASAAMQSELERLRIRYPAGTVTSHTLGGKLLFWSFVLNGP